MSTDRTPKTPEERMTWLFGTCRDESHGSPGYARTLCDKCILEQFRLAEERGRREGLEAAAGVVASAFRLGGVRTPQIPAHGTACSCARCHGMHALTEIRALADGRTP